LFEQSHAIFGALLADTSSTASRIVALGARVDSLLQSIPELEQKVAGNVDTADSDSGVSSLQSGKATKFVEDAQLLVADKRPQAIVSLCSRALPPPNLAALDEFAEDGSSCLKKYTNPEFFFEMWFKEQEERYNQARQRREARRERELGNTKTIEKKVRTVCVCVCVCVCVSWCWPLTKAYLVVRVRIRIVVRV
jgi:hypothetical protein